MFEKKRKLEELQNESEVYKAMAGLADKELTTAVINDFAEQYQEDVEAENNELAAGVMVSIKQITELYNRHHQEDPLSVYDENNEVYTGIVKAQSENVRYKIGFNRTEIEDFLTEDK